MKKIGLILLAFTLLIGCESTGISPKVGEIAPDFSLVDISEREVRLSDFNGNKNVVLVFYQNHDWYFCVEQLGELQKRSSEIKKFNAEVIAIASNGDQWDVEVTKKSLKITFTLIPQPNRKVAEDYGVWDSSEDRAIATIIVDKNGVIRFKNVGGGPRPSVSKIIKELQDI